VLDLLEIDLVERLDLDLLDVRKLVDAVAQSVATRSVNVRRSAVPLCTGMPLLDAHLGGGLPPCAVTELVGRAGVGKTQLCLAVAARALIDGASFGARVVYIDTEGSFSASRLMQLLLALGAPSALGVSPGCGGGAQAHAPHAPLRRTSAFAPPAEELLRRVTLLHPSSWDEYCLCVDQYAAEELQTPPHVALLVVDSIAMAVHRHFCKEGDMPRRQSAVGAHAAALKRLADTHATTVLCVNQVSGGARGHGPAAEGDCAHVTGLEDEQLGVALGIAWTHCVNMRLVLQHPPLTHADHAPAPPLPPERAIGTSPARPMVLRVAKSPVSATASFGYAVGEAGLVPSG
jgi:RAD51-like protein 1